MTKDEDDWLSEFLEAAQASARQSQAAAEKEYSSNRKLLAPRFERARAGDAEGGLAKQLAESEALAAQKKFDAASDALDEASALAASLIRAAAIAAAAAVVTAPEVSGVPDAIEIEDAKPEESPVEEPAVSSGESAAEVAPISADAAIDDLLSGVAETVDEPAAPDLTGTDDAENKEPASEAPAVSPDESSAQVVPENADTSLDDLLSGMTPAAEPSAEEPAASEAAPDNADTSLDDLLSGMTPTAEPSAEEPAASEAAPDNADISLDDLLSGLTETAEPSPAKAELPGDEDSSSQER